MQIYLFKPRNLNKNADFAQNKMIASASSNRKTILSSTMAVALLAMLIKLLGLIKQSVLAAYCGATDETDMFFIASGVLVSLCAIIFSSIAVSLLTIHTDTYIHNGREASNDLINLALRRLLPIAGLITVFFFVAAPLISRFLAPHYPLDKTLILARYIRMLSIVFILWCYYLTVNVILETDKRFLPGRGQGLFQNIFLILAAVFVYRSRGVDSLIYALLLSGIAECILVTWCSRHRFRLLFGKLATPKAKIQHLVKLSLPLILGSAIYEVNDIVDKQISSGLGEGNVSFLAYGSTIADIVTGVIVSAISLVLFAHFSDWVSQGEPEKVDHYFKKSLTYTAILVFPIVSFCIFAGEDLIKVLYQRGFFGTDAVHHTYWVAIGYAVGLLFSSARAITVKVFYAFQNTRSPMVNGIVSVALNIILSITLSRFLGVWGIALATSIAMLFSFGLLCFQLKPLLPSMSLSDILPEVIKGLISFLGASAVLIALKFLKVFDNVYISFFVKGVLCLACYSGLLLILKSKTIDSLRAMIFNNPSRA